MFKVYITSMTTFGNKIILRDGTFKITFKLLVSKYKIFTMHITFSETEGQCTLVEHKGAPTKTSINHLN